MYRILYDSYISLLQERTDDKKKVFQLAAGKSQHDADSFPKISQKRDLFWVLHWSY